MLFNTDKSKENTKKKTKSYKNTGATFETFLENDIYKIRKYKACKNVNKSKKTKREASLGEIKIAEYLRSISITFITEKRFPDLKNPETNQHLRMDFFLPEHKICIEFDGRQHYKFSKKYHTDEKQFKSQQRKDMFKDKYCKNKGYIMIRIKYNQFHQIENIINSHLYTHQNNR